jgi:signal transduction histidine kinase
MGAAAACLRSTPPFCTFGQDNQSHLRVTMIACRQRRRGNHAGLFLVIAALCHQISPAQILDLQHYTVRQGLPSNNVTCLYQDSRGNLWIGTNDGLSMFDGKVFKNYGTIDGLPQSIITGLIEDRRRPGLFWIATGGGLCTFDGERILPAGPAAYSGRGISSVFQDHTGTIWYAAEDTLLRLAGDSTRVVRTRDPLRGMGQILEAGDSLVWIHHAHGLAVYSFRKDTITSCYTTVQTENGMRPMCLDQEGVLWVNRMSEDLRTSSIVRIRGRDVIGGRSMTPGQRMDFLLDDRYGYLYAGNYTGVYRISKARPSPFLAPALSRQNGLPDNSLKAGLVDREGNLWIGSATQGISRLSDWSTTLLPLTNIESGHRSSVAAADTADHLWIASEAGLHELSCNTDGSWHHSLRAIRDRPLSVFCDRQNLLWIAFHDTSLSCFSIRYSRDRPAMLREVRRFVPRRDFPGGYPITVLVDSGGRAWYSLGNRGIVVVDRTRTNPLVKVFGLREGVPLNYIRCMSEESSGRIWCGSYQEGISCVELSGRIDSADLAHARSALHDREIRSLLHDREGRMWVGTRAGGLAVRDHGSWRTITARDGLPSNTIWTITEDRQARIWVGTAVGAVRIDSTLPLRIHRKRELTGPAVFCSGEFRSGQLWFISTEGVVMYDPELERPHNISPLVHITSFTAAGETFDPHSEITLAYDRSSCTIEFMSPTFMEPEAVRYQYRMKPRDANWQGPSSGTRVMYDVLPPGRYTFEVQAVDGSGIGSPAPAIVSLTIIPPVWQRWWFVAAGWITAALIVGGTIRRWEKQRIQKNIQALEREHAVQRERLRIAQDMHDEIGSALSEIVIIGNLARQQTRIPHTIRRQIDTIAEKSREALDSIGEIVWATNPRNDPLQNFAAYTRQYASRYLEAAGIRSRIEIPDDLPSTRISAEQRRNLFLAVKEALHNVVKHAGASEVILRMTAKQDRLEVVVADNGRGLPDNPASRFGSGLAGMQRRMTDIGGTFSAIPGPGGKGTSIYLILRIAIADNSPEIHA